MKILAILLLMLSCFGCAHAAPVTLDMTLPLYNDPNALCSVAQGDTCKDLATLWVWAQQQGRTDSTLVAQQPVGGRQGQPISVTFDRAEGLWYFWCWVTDVAGNRSCVSNTASKQVAVRPGPPTIR